MHLCVCAVTPSPHLVAFGLKWHVSECRGCHAQCIAGMTLQDSGSALMRHVMLAVGSGLLFAM